MRTKRADLDLRQTQRAQLVADTCQRSSEVTVDVVRQGLQRRDINNARLVLKRAGKRVAYQAIDGGEESRERFARARRRGDENVSSGLNGRPRVDLCGSWCFKSPPKPRGNRRMKRVEYVHARNRIGDGANRIRRRHAKSTAWRGSAVRMDRTQLSSTGAAPALYARAGRFELPSRAHAGQRSHPR